MAFHDAQMLGNCIRLCDYMFKSSLVKVVIASAKDFLHKLEHTPKLYSMSVAFADRVEADMTTVFDPNEEDFMVMVNKLFSG